MDATEISAFFGGLVLLIGALVAAFVAWNGRTIRNAVEPIHEALVVLNGMTPGEQIDAATLARLRNTPRAERTKTEQKHLDDAPPSEAPQGPSTAEIQTEAIYKAVNGKPDDQPPLYDMVATLEIKFDAHAAETSARLDRLEGWVGAPPDEPARGA